MWNVCTAGEIFMIKDHLVDYYVFLRTKAQPGAESRKITTKRQNTNKSGLNGKILIARFARYS